jgi:hypothetical protein
MKQTLKNALIGATMLATGLGATNAQAQQRNDTICFDQQDAEYTEDTTPFHYEPVRDQQGNPQKITIQDPQGNNLQTYDLAQPPQTPDSTAESIANTYADVINQRTGGIANIDGKPGRIDSQREQQLENKLKQDITTHLAYVNSDGDCTTPQFSPDDITITTTDGGLINDIYMDVDNPVQTAEDHESIIYNSQTDRATPSIFRKGGLTGDHDANALLPYLNRPEPSPQVVTQTDTDTVTTTQTVTDTVKTSDTGPTMTFGGGYTHGEGPTLQIGVDNLGKGFSLSLIGDYDLPNTETQRAPGDIRQIGTDITQGGTTFPEGSYIQPVSQSQSTKRGIGGAVMGGYDITDNVEAQAGPGLEATITETTGKEYLRGDFTPEATNSTDATYKNAANPLGGPYKESNTDIDPTINAGIKGSLDNGLGVQLRGEYNLSTDEISPSASITYTFD